jgi:type I restriction enzyme S subunit
MTEEYPFCRLGEVATVQGGFAFKSGDFTEAGVPVLKIKNVRLREVDPTEPAYVDESVAKGSARYYCKTGDLLISMTGSGPQAPNSVVGRVARFTGPSDKYLINQRVGRFVNRAPDRLDQQYLFYVLAQEDTLWKLVSVATGSANQANVSGSQIEDLEIPLPPLSTQRLIASVLGALDDKIELNRRMNATLEAMARALFQSWFVDFDPVRAKLGGRHPKGMDAETAALFPAEFEESMLGPIPKGWEVAEFSELTTLITKGTTPTQSDITDAPASGRRVNYVRVNSIDEDGSILADKLTTIPEAVHSGVLKRSILKSNDVLYTIAGTIGRVALAENWILPANINQAVAIIRAKPEIPPDFLALTMRHEVFRAELHNNIVQAVQANLSLGMLSKATAVVPDRSTLQELFKPIGAILSQINANRAQSRTLATLRDTLLPKLLSGEVRVGEAAHFIQTGS